MNWEGLQQKCGKFLCNRYSPFRGYPELLLVMLICLSPLMVLAISSAVEVFRGNTDALALMVPGGRRFSLLSGTVGLGVCVAFAGMLIGAAAASTILSDNFPWKNSLIWLIILFAVVPPYVHAFSWFAFVDTINALLSQLALPQIVLSGWTGSWWIQLVTFIPLAFGMGLLGFKAVSPNLIEVGRIMTKDMKVFTKIVLPLAMPAIAAGGAFLFLMSVADYSVPVLFQKNVYSLEVYAEYSANGYPWNAFLLSLPLLFITFIAIFISQYPLKKAALSLSRQTRTWLNPPVWPAYFAVVQMFACSIILLVFVVPLITLFLDVGSAAKMLDSILAAKEEITYSFWIAGMSAAVSLIPAVLVAFKMTGSKKVSLFLWIAVFVPVVVPPPLVGIGLISIWNRSLPYDIYGSSFMPVLAALARFFPLAVLIMVAQIRRINPLLFEAAELLPVSRLSRWARIKIPLIAPGLITGFCLVFALTIGELGATIIVAPPGQTTLAIHIFNMLHYGAGDAVAGLSLFLVLIILLAVAFGTASMLAGQNLLQRSSSEHDRGA